MELRLSLPNPARDRTSFRKTTIRAILALACASLLAGCIATAPVKVVGKTAKVGTKAAVSGVKAGASLVTPNGDKEETEE